MPPLRGRELACGHAFGNPAALHPIAHLTGNGPLRHEGREIGVVEYKIAVYRNQAQGSVWGATGVLHEALTLGSVQLTLTDGRVVDIALTSWSPGDPAKIHVNTPLA